jgi:hypothetical protein
MTGIIGIVALLTILSLSLIITRLTTVALSLTGLSHESARFQARTAFTGTGLTTKEAETVVNHPVRRRIIMVLMLLRSAGVVSILLSLILSFAVTEVITRFYRLIWLVDGVIVFWALSLSKPTNRILNRIIEWGPTTLDCFRRTRLYQSLTFAGRLSYREMKVKENGWLSGKTISICQLRDEGVTIVGIYRDSGRYVGVPKASTKIHPGDTLVLYDRAVSLENLAGRREGISGKNEHEESS